MAREQNPTTLVPLFMVLNLLIGFGAGAAGLVSVARGERDLELFVLAALAVPTIAGAVGLGYSKSWSIPTTAATGMIWLGLIAWFLYRVWKVSHFHENCCCLMDLKYASQFRLSMFSLAPMAFYWVVCVLTLTNPARRVQRLR